ncbi:MAG: SURF1 family protein, partial [Panacagrimonas sp.]
MQLSLGPYRLQAHPVIFTVALALFGLMMSLGFWQIDRGNYKRQLASSMLQSQMDQAQSLRLDTEPPHGAHTPRVKLQGDLAVDRLLLLDGQSHQRVPGYHIWTPVRLDAGWVIVNQGWVAQGASRDILPELEIDAGQTVFEGFWRPLPKAGLRLGDNDC